MHMRDVLQLLQWNSTQFQNHNCRGSKADLALQ